MIGALLAADGLALECALLLLVACRPSAGQHPAPAPALAAAVVIPDGADDDTIVIPTRVIHPATMMLRSEADLIRDRFRRLAWANLDANGVFDRPAIEAAP